MISIITSCFDQIHFHSICTYETLSWNVAAPISIFDFIKMFFLLPLILYFSWRFLFPFKRKHSIVLFVVTVSGVEIKKDIIPTCDAHFPGCECICWSAQKVSVAWNGNDTDREKWEKQRKSKMHFITSFSLLVKIWIGCVSCWTKALHFIALSSCFRFDTQIYSF